MNRQVLIAVGVILASAVLIFLAKPPATVCDAQLEILQKDLKTVFGSTRSKLFGKTPEIQAHTSACVEGNSAGACFDYFQDLKKTLNELSRYPLECQDQTDSLLFIQTSFVNGMIVLARIWKSPENWLEPSDLRLFCDLKSNLVHFFGDEISTAVIAKINHEDEEQKADPTKKVPTGRASARPLTQLDCRQYR